MSANRERPQSRGTRLPAPFAPLGAGESLIGGRPTQRKRNVLIDTGSGAEIMPRDGRDLVRGSNHPDSVLDERV
jgi:hypothetical protein